MRTTVRVGLVVLGAAMAVCGAAGLTCGWLWCRPEAAGPSTDRVREFVPQMSAIDLNSPSADGPTDDADPERTEGGNQRIWSRGPIDPRAIFVVSAESRDEPEAAVKSARDVSFTAQVAFTLAGLAIAVIGAWRRWRRIGVAQAP